MIDLNHCNEWQRRDEIGMILPWYTKSFLDELVTWELKDKVVFEYGGGASTVWWAKKCKQVFGVESNDEYSEAVNKALGGPAIKFEAQKGNYVNDVFYCGVQYDIIIIDGEPIAWRDACVQPALDCLKPGGRLIFDNWMQPSVGWIPNEETQRILSQYPVQVYHQEGHQDWKTAVFTKEVTYKQLCQEYKELRAKVDMINGGEQLSALSRLKEIDKQLKQMEGALGRFTGGSTNYKAEP